MAPTTEAFGERLEPVVGRPGSRTATATSLLARLLRGLWDAYVEAAPQCIGTCWFMGFPAPVMRVRR